SGEIKQLTVDMVVLSTCITPPKDIKDLSDSLGIELNEYGFIQTKPYFPIETTKEGIYTCGCAHEPMDIPRSVTEASAAAARAAELIKGGSY
ncbi:MAG: CoB--CoM heterodisulfide reductase iron-sulfur subunit A family protein, partial [Promethearchaeota archaeon]